MAFRGRAPFRDFQPLLLPAASGAPVASSTRQLLAWAAEAGDLDACAYGVGLVLAAARAGTATAEQAAAVVGADPQTAGPALERLVGAGLAERDDSTSGYRPADVPATAGDGVRYVSVAVQTLAVNAAANRWDDPALVTVGVALVHATAPAAGGLRRPASTADVAARCGLGIDAARARVRELLRRHAAVGLDEHLPIVPDRLWSDTGGWHPAR